MVSLIDLWNLDVCYKVEGRGLPLLIETLEVWPVHK